MEIAIPGPGKHKGRPHGARNYGGISLIARQFKAQGVDWRVALVDAYKALDAAKPDSPECAKAAILVEFWREALPFVAVKLELKMGDRGLKPSYKPRKMSTKTAMAKIAELEAR